MGNFNATGIYRRVEGIHTVDGRNLAPFKSRKIV